MYKTPNSSIFKKQNGLQASSFNNDKNCFSGDSFSKYNYQIADLEKKMQSFGGMDEVQQDIISELNRSGHRIEALVSKVRTFLKLQPQIKRDRKSTSFSSYSPTPIQGQSRQVNVRGNSSQVNKGQGRNMRLKDRVEKALEQQDSRTQNVPKQPKYIK